MSGIQPAENFVIETIYDVSDPRLTEFRDSVYEEDLELDKSCRTLSFDKIKLCVNENKFEDAWKYSDEKWYRVGFNAIEAIIEDGKIVGMSGCRIYGNFLRSSMHLYLLKRVRKKYPGIKYLKNGWFERHIDFANKFNMKGIFFTVYAYSRKLQALINNHRGKTISLIDKKHLNYIQDVREIGEFQFNNVPQTFFYYKLTEEFDISNVLSNNNKIVRTRNSLKKIFLQEDILPLGKFESLPVSSIFGGRDVDYPNVIKLRDDIDFNTLYTESLHHINLIGASYVKDRMEYLPKGINEETLRSVLGGVGFYTGSYQSFSLRKLGTSELEDWIEPCTRRLIETLGVNTFRQQYAVAYGGWNTKLHRDHENFLTHGFRLMVPLSSDVYMGYEDEFGNPLIYRLDRGGMYFVNIAKMHRGFNESLSDDRINLIMQMDSDIILKDKEKMTPLSNKEISKLPTYALDYDIWDFGYEL